MEEYEKRKEDDEDYNDSDDDDDHDDDKVFFEEKETNELLEQWLEMDEEEIGYQSQKIDVEMERKEEKKIMKSEKGKEEETKMEEKIDGRKRNRGCQSEEREEGSPSSRTKQTNWKSSSPAGRNQKKHGNRIRKNRH